jgi:hypothetical protein
MTDDDGDLDAVIRHLPLPPPHPGRTSEPENLAARRVQAIGLKLGGATWAQVAAHLGYHDESAARRMVLDTLNQHEVEAVNELRAVENARYDTAQIPVWTMMMNPRLEPDVRLRAVDSFLRISARRSRLNGMDAPQKVEVTTDARRRLEAALTALRATVVGEVVESRDDDPEAPA